MSDTVIKSILLLTSLSVAGYWRHTSPYTLRDWLSIFRKPHSMIILFFECILILQFFNYISIPLPFSFLRTPGILLGLFVNIAGTILAMWAKYTMRENWGIPAQHTIEKQRKLVTSGPFTFTRNPIYVGLLCMLIGLELALWSSFMFLSIPLFVVMHKAIQKEEQLLKKYFGSSYTAYMHRVPRYLFA